MREKRKKSILIILLVVIISLATIYTLESTAIIPQNSPSTSITRDSQRELPTIPGINKRVLEEEHSIPLQKSPVITPPTTEKGISRAAPAVAYHDSDSYLLKFIQCESLDCSRFKSPVILDTGVYDYGFVSMKYGVDGFPIIAYGKGDYFAGGSQRELRVVHCTSIDCSTFNPPITLESSTNNLGWFTDISLAVGVDEFPIISYQERSTANLKVVHCTSIDCSTFNPPTTLDANIYTGQFTSITIGADNFPIISYFQSSSWDLKVVHCTSIDCSTSDAPIYLDTMGKVGVHTSITIGSDNLPIISYGDRTANTLKVAHCTSLDCSTSDITTLDQLSDWWSAETSITIGSDNLPIISYKWFKFNPPFYEMLKAVHCTSQDCSTFDTPIIVDPDDWSGYYSSITIGSDNLPIIFHVDGGLDDNLQAVHCTSQDCSTTNPKVILDNPVGYLYSILSGSSP